MRLLDRYLLRELLIPLAYCLGGFLLFYCAFDLIAKLHRFQEYKMTLSDCVQYYVITAPELLVTIIIPVALLLALLFAITNHARYNEFTAMRAAGVSMWRLAVPYLAVGAVLSVVTFAIDELWVPGSVDKVENLFTRRLDKKQDQINVKQLKFFNEADNRFWDVGHYNSATMEMTNVVIIWGFPNGSRREIYADSAKYNGAGWTFSNVYTHDYASQRAPVPVNTNYPVLNLPFAETPEFIKSEIRVNKMDLKQAAKGPQLSIASIVVYLRQHPRLAADRQAVLMTQLQSRIAEPFKCLMVVLIAIPFGARSGRRNVFVGVAASIFICFFYFILQNICLSFGIGRYLPPWIAAWLPNAIFGVTGIVLTSRVR